MPGNWKTFGADVRENTGHGGRTCAVAQLLDRLGARPRREVERAIADPDVSAAAIFAALDARGLTLIPSPWSIRHHRRGDCRCGK
jgi:hypothetical protein